MADKFLEIPCGYYIESLYSNEQRKSMVITVYQSLDRSSIHDGREFSNYSNPPLQHIIRLDCFCVTDINKMTLEDYITQVNEGIIKIIKNKKISSN